MLQKKEENTTEVGKCHLPTPMEISNNWITEYSFILIAGNVALLKDSVRIRATLAACGRSWLQVNIKTKEIKPLRKLVS